MSDGPMRPAMLVMVHEAINAGVARALARSCNIGLGRQANVHRSDLRQRHALSSGPCREPGPCPIVIMAQR